MGNFVAEKEKTEPEDVLVDKIQHERFMLSIDYSRSLSDMITAGNYIDPQETSDFIQKYFSLEIGTVAKENVRSKIFSFEHVPSSGQIIDIMHTEGYAPARIEHLLAFGEKYPYYQKWFPVIALGSSGIEKIGIKEFGDSTLIVYPILHLGGHEWSERILEIAYDVKWTPSYHFLAVKE